MGKKVMYKGHTTRGAVLSGDTVTENNKLGYQIFKDFGECQDVIVTVEMRDKPDGAIIGLPGVAFPLKPNGGYIMDANGHEIGDFYDKTRSEPIVSLLNNLYNEALTKWREEK